MGNGLEHNPGEIRRSDLLGEGITKSLVKQAYNGGSLSKEMCGLAIACIFFGKEEDGSCHKSFSISKLRKKMNEKLGLDIGNSLDVNSEEFQKMAETSFIFFNPSTRKYRGFSMSDNPDQHYILSQAGVEIFQAKIRPILLKYSTGSSIGNVQPTQRRIGNSIVAVLTKPFRRRSSTHQT